MNRRLVAPVVGIIVFLGLWELLVRATDVKPFILRAPSRIASYLFHNPGDYANAAWITALHALGGLCIALAGR